jgi:hypothetical protein
LTFSGECRGTAVLSQGYYPSANCYENGLNLD